MKKQLINEVNKALMMNDGHMQFHTDFKRLVEKEGTDVLGVAELWRDSYLPWYAREVEALDFVRGNTQAADTVECEAQRDFVVRGFFRAAKTSLTHFDAAKCKSAERLQVVLNTYKGLPNKGDDDQTAATVDMLAELRQSDNAADITKLCLTEWLTQIESTNNAYVEQKRRYYDTASDKTHLRMKSVRLELDDAYDDVITRIEAQAVLGDASKYEPFARKLNTLIDHYRNVVKLRQGIRAAKNKKAESGNSSAN